MKILFITRKYPPAVGGMELFAYELSHALSNKTNIVLVKWSGYGRLKMVLWAVPSLFFRSFWQLLKGGIDVIHAQDGVLAPVAFILSKIFRKPYIVVIHGLEATYTDPVFGVTVPPAVRRADAVVCISRAAAEATKQAGVPEEKIRQLPLAVKDLLYGKADRHGLLKKLGLPGNTQIVLSVGRLVPRKGVGWFVNNVMPDLTRRYPNLIYLVIGEGPDGRNIENAIQQQHLTESVYMLGRVESDLLAAAYNGADIYAMPNVQITNDMEGFGLVLLEAALCELPTVASNLEGIADAVADGRNGVLVPPGNAGAFIDQIGGFLDNPKAAKQFGKKSRQYTLENYQWPKIAEQYLEVYSQVSRLQ